MRGRIIKGIAGFYYVLSGEDVYSCRAAGILRKQGIRPLVGDEVIFEITHSQDREGNINTILERKSTLFRPAVANIDLVVLVISLKDPLTSFLFLDRLLVALDSLGFWPLIFINKCDLDRSGEAGGIQRIYEGAGYRVLTGSAAKGMGISSLRAELRGHVSALAGASGVGKSTIINSLTGEKIMKVGDISRRTRRGRQTTRHAELFLLDTDSFIMDTPGFSSLSLEGVERERLKDYFKEFFPFGGECRFTDCSHIYEGDDICGVRRAYEQGLIPKSRYESYEHIYKEL